MFDAFISVVESKSLFSNAARLEQANFLIDTNFFIGDGIGNFVRKIGQFRNYNNQIYYELQTLYIYNQIGIIGLSLFYAVNILGLKGIKHQNEKLILYLIYLFYTFWNPYCFDTTQMMAIITLINVEFNYPERKLYVLRNGGRL